MQILDYFSNLNDNSPNKNIITQLIKYNPVINHKHNFIEFLIIVSGNCNHNLNSVQQTLNIGDALMIVPTDCHQLVEPHSQDFLHRDIIISLDYFKKICDYFSDNLYQTIINKQIPLVAHLSTENISQIEKYINNMKFASSDETYNLITNLLVTYLINIFLGQQLKSLLNYPQWIIDLLDRFQNPANLHYPLSEFIKNIPLNKSYICREFKKHIGITMTDYFNRQKITYAFSLLQNTDMSIAQICEIINLNNVSHFYELFKKTYNTTPNKIRILTR